MTDNVIALFKGAGLPSADVAQFRKALNTAQQVVVVAGGTPFLKMAKQDGSWVYGANETEVEEGSQWAVNPLSLKVGFVCWNPKGGKPLGQQMRSIFQEPLQKQDLPDLGAPWDENIGLELQCLNGEDKGTSVEYTANSHGGRKAFAALVAELQKQLDTDPANIVPIVSLSSDSYKHAQYGLIFNPIFEVVGWMSMQGPEKAAEPPPAEKPPAEPAKRRGRPPAATSTVTDPAIDAAAALARAEAAAAAATAAAAEAAAAQRVAEAVAAAARGNGTTSVSGAGEGGGVGSTAGAGGGTAGADPVTRRRRRVSTI